MNTAVAQPSGAEPKKNYLTNGTTLGSWLFTLDHKRIGVLYIFSILLFFLAGAMAALFIRIDLLSSGAHGAHKLLTSETYNKLFTMHGIVMIFFFLIPSIPGVLGNFLIPVMVGARDMAFPRLNLLSWYVYIAGGVLALGAIIAGGVDTGWTFYTPYSTMYANSHVILAVAGAFISGFSSILTALNIVVTVHKMRCPGLTWFRLPLFVWAMYATSLLQILGTPVIATTLALIFAERAFHLPIFNPFIGGDPVLFQHLFWFYSHPAVYIMILPAMGVISEVIACFSRRRIYGYRFVAYSSLAIGALGFFVWGHHMFVSSQSIWAGLVFSFLTFFIGIPTAIKLLNWMMTMHKGSVSFEAPMLYAFGFLGLFTIGGVTGLFLATSGTNVFLHDTYFVVAHFHYVMVGGGVMGFLAGLHFWWPKITGRLYPDVWARFAAIIVFVGFNLTFFPQFQMGANGMNRRYHFYAEQFQTLHIMSTAGATVLGMGYLLVFGYMIWSLFYGKKASANPWGARGLEWETSTPPPTENFLTSPVVIHEAYAYEFVSETSERTPSGIPPERPHV